MRQWLPTVILALVMASPAWADRVQVFSVQGSECGNCEAEVAPYIKKIKDVKKWFFDSTKYEFTITLADNVSNEAVVAAFERQGCYRATLGAGQGAKPGTYKAEPYPEGADVAVVTATGEEVGPLEKLRVHGKYTVLDFYADWCGPCRGVDKQLRGILSERTDVAVRKLNIVDFESPLARELGSKLKALPYVVVFDPAGKRSEITGGNPEKLSAVLNVNR